MSKKILRKVMDPLKLPDPLDLWGEKQAKQEKMAKQAAQAQEGQARAQAMQASEASAQAARQIQLDTERMNAQQAAAEQNTISTETPTITLAFEDAVQTADKRKKFRGQSVGGTGAASLRV